ncbi:hypothetical protein [Xenorhabdus nematophila]|uniref:MmyB family transcriptional regulator n=1 Tax=Xenorhabdus nematophila TaxID=628 RepID=UPI0039C68130
MTRDQLFSSTRFFDELLSLIDKLKEVSDEFNELWNCYDINGPYSGVRDLFIDEIGALRFEHYSLIVDVHQNIRMVYYAIKEEDRNEIFNNWLMSKK